jgi:hypothetical protein
MPADGNKVFRKQTLGLISNHYLNKKEKLCIILVVGGKSKQAKKEMRCI